MTIFTTRNVSHAEVPAPIADIWAVLSSPDLLAEMTPLIRGITAEGDRWCWQLGGIDVLGIQIAPSFSERMTFTPMTRIEFAHEPPAGSTERGGANGTYRLEPVTEAVTSLCIDIELCADLPLPRLSRRAVEGVMAVSMTKTGDAFAERLYRHLGLDPTTRNRRTSVGAPA